MFDITRFVHPHFLWLLWVLPAMILYYVYRFRQGRAAVQISTVAGLRKLPRTYKYYLQHLPLVFRLLAVGLLIVALARPQSSEHNSTSTTEGIDIILSLDVSGSMLARDFRPDRITASKEVAARFVMDRPNDRIGLVVFAGESFTQSPLTTDKASLLNLLARLRCGMIEDGTAIGNGLATAVNRLKDSDAKSRVVILLTDGVNNRGQIPPLTAAEIAKTYGIRVYTIGVGTTGMAPSPTIDIWGRLSFQMEKVEIDEKVLTEIAQLTGGQYFRATDKEALKAVYDEINSLEKSKVEVNEYVRYREHFIPFVLMAMLLLLAEFAVKRVWLRQIP